MKHFIHILLIIFLICGGTPDSWAASKDTLNLKKNTKLRKKEDLVAGELKKLPWLTDVRPPKRADYYVFVMGHIPILDNYTKRGHNAHDVAIRKMAIINKAYPNMRKKNIAVIFIMTSGSFRNPDSWAQDIQRAKKIIRHFDINAPCAFSHKLPHYPQIPGLKLASLSFCRTAVKKGYSRGSLGRDEYTYSHNDPNINYHWHAIDGVGTYACDCWTRFSSAQWDYEPCRFIGYHVKSGTSGIESIVSDNQGKNPPFDQNKAYFNDYQTIELFEHWEILFGFKKGGWPTMRKAIWWDTLEW